MELREARRSDIAAILGLQHASYPLLATIALWREVHLESHQAKFPAGQLVAVVEGRVVGHSASFMVSSRVAFQPHTFREITAAGTFANHDPDGDALYGAEIMVHPDFRRQGIATNFYERRFQLVRSRGLRYFVAGGRLPGLESHRAEFTPEAYVEEVVAGRLSDRVLSAQLKAGLRVKAVMRDYMSDPRSGNAATLLVWENPDVVEPRLGARRA